MGELAFQTSLARFLTDPAVRGAVLATGDRTAGDADGFGLHAEDLARLRGLDRGRTAVFSNLLVLNRASKVTDGLPWTTALLGSELWSMAPEFNRTCPPTNPKKFREAMAFVHFLEERFSRRPPEPPFLADVLVYESTVLELRFHARLEPLTRTPDGHALIGPGQGDRQLTSVPSLLPGTRVVALRYDVEAIGRAIEQGEPPAFTPERPTCILMRLDQSGVVHQDEINLPTLLFIEACDGATTLEAIAADLATQLSPEGVSADFVQACVELGSSLRDRGILDLRPG